ncbi:unnamed protein product [Rhizoctonia solani]|uniref:Uncharacterized protein n=1 Tax=Rhizoctonia solani TaxID=456999 RepID=A0A8H3AT70_9AGAM|nr:unnamed protein product [Rhizoctonia solani]
MEPEPTTAVAATVAAPGSPPSTQSQAEDEGTPVRRESKRLRDKGPAPVLVNLPPHPPRENSNPNSNSTSNSTSAPLHFSTKHYPASAHGERRQQHTHFPRLPPDHAPGPLPDGASASFSYRGPPQPPVPGAAPPVPPPPGGTPLVLDRERPPPPPEFEYSGASQQAVLANMLSQRIDQVDQLRTQLAHAEARIASLSARSNPSAALAQAESRAEQAEARLAAIKEAWRGVESYLDMLSRREAEARSAFVRTLGTGEIGVPPSVPMFGNPPTSPYLPVRPPVPPNVPSRATTFPALPPAPVPGGNPVIWRHESGRRRPAAGEDADEPPNKRQKGERERRGRDRELRKEKARFSDSPSPPPAGSKKDKEPDLSPPIASITDKDADPDADGDADEEVDQIVDDVEMAAPSTTTATTTTTTTTTKKPTSPDTGDKDAEGSPDTDTDLSVDEELLKLTSKAKKPRREREYTEVDREFARTDYSAAYPPHPDYGRHYGGWYGEYYHPEEYREPVARGYPAPPRAEFAQRNGSAPTGAAPWYAHLKPNPAQSTNTQGQRTCRQCGLPGRYKDGKCVEKWGPGPEGPGTVCDR